MKNITISIVCLIALLLSACSDWLDIKPSDRVDEKTAFSNLAGFRQALNGVYVKLNDANLYGKALTSEFVEILAQHYAVSPQATNNNLLLRYEYGGTNAMSRISAIWSTAYNLIANTNLILKNCELQRGLVLTDDYYNLIKGEALALRAMLHFDLFRLFGPIYSLDEEVSSIPYYTEFSLETAPTLSSISFMEQVITDLTDAEKALEKDPVITFGTEGDKSIDFFKYRNLRLNYYAVQALLARAYLYMGGEENNEKAYEYANKVIEIHEKWFPWISQMAITGDSPDRVFSSELLFSLQNLNRGSLYSSLFDGTYLKAESLLAPKDDVLTDFFGWNKHDFRYVTWFGNQVELGGVVYKIFNKYQGSSKGNDDLHYQLIPMIRIGEMFLIAAETATTNADGAPYLNKLRNQRGLSSVSERSYRSYIIDEYRLEFYGEGQLFYYYKRNNTKYIKSCDLYTDINMVDKNYILPIPNGELEYN